MTAASWQEVGDRVFRRRYPSLDLNVGAVVGGDQVLVVDTRSCAAEARELQDELRALTPLPWRQVVNTHAHFDHCFGNAAFRPAVIWGHGRCARALRTAGEAQRTDALRWLPGQAAAIAAVEIVPPDRLVAGRAVLDVGGRAVELRFLGRGHTDHDLVALVPDAGVVFAGDLVEEGAAPAFDDAWPLAWPATLGRLLALGAAVVVPGHGDAVGPAFVHRQRRDLAAMAELCRRAASGELDGREAVRLAPFPAEAARLALGRTGALAG